MKIVLKYTLVVLALVGSQPTPASAEFSILFYVGKSFTSDGDLRLKKGDRDLTFRRVRWEDKSFKAPVYYGVRASYWFDQMRDWGVAVDFTHAKTILQEQDIVPVTGLRDGAPVDGRERIADSLQHFELSHGLNMLTFNGLYRWFPAGKRDESPSGRLQCYTGLGAGVSIPHVEAHLKDERTGREEWTGRYQIAAGPVLNGMLGLNYDFADALSGTLEYKLSYSDTHADLNGGGHIDAETFTNQFISGLSGYVR
jgi:lipid A oxidase